MRRMGILLVLVSVAAGSVPSASGQVPAHFATENIEYIKTAIEQTDTAGGVFHGDYVYITTARALSIYDISDPLNPALTGVLPLPQQPQFSEEDPDTNGKILLVGTLNILFVVDVEDKTNPTIVGQLQGADEHTISCVLDCKWGYGSEGVIVDLRDPTAPKLAGDWTEGMPATVSHDVTEIKPGHIVTSSSPIMYLDATDNPAKPKLVGVGAVRGGAYIHGNLWPHEGTDRFLLVGSESGGNCGASETTGRFMTWDASRFAQTHTFTQIDEYGLENGNPMEGDAAANSFCGHWFTTHPTYRDGGLVAFSSYEHGVRLYQVKSDGKIAEVGWFLPVGGASSAAYWVTDRIIYSLDYQRGLDILRYTGKTFYEPTGSGGDGGGGGGGGGDGGGKLPGPGVQLRISDRTPVRGDTVRFRVSLRRCAGHKGTLARLQRKKKGAFVTVASKRLGSNCRATFRLPAEFRKATFRGHWPKQDDDHRAGKSRPQTVETHR